MTARALIIESRLREALAADEVAVVDQSHLHAGHEGAKSGGGHFAVTIVSSRFSGKTPLQRHQMVYEALREMMKKEVHALSIRAMAPGENHKTTSEANQ